MSHSRYGIFFTPAPGAFASTGADWLGWDSAAATQIPGACDEVISTPQKYGFHGTIKPPFRLSQGLSPADLQQAVEKFCATHAPVQVQGLALARLGSFVALIPQGDTADLADLGDLAGNAVQQLDHFRAPASAAELAKRRAARLSPRQDANLLKWGYPYVFEDFKFHMTLSNRLPKARAKEVLQQAATVFEPLIPSPFVIDALTLVGERQDGRFEQITRYPLLAR